MSPTQWTGRMAPRMFKPEIDKFGLPSSIYDHVKHGGMAGYCNSASLYNLISNDDRLMRSLRNSFFPQCSASR